MPRTLILSQRKIKQHVAGCAAFEFEDLISEMDDVEIFSPLKTYTHSQNFYSMAKYFTRSSKLASMIKPDPNPYRPTQEFELFFAIFQTPWEFLSIDSIKNWRKKTQKAACLIIELWQKDVEGWKDLLELLSEFDHIFTCFYYSVDDISKATGRPCSYLPLAVDALTFCPYPVWPDRYIDVCYMGRRTQPVHQVLLAMAQANKIHYVYDTASNFSVYEPTEHRYLLASTIKRSRYFFANYAKVNEPLQTGSQKEFGYRFYEGAAGGAVLLGAAPGTPPFYEQFDWPDAVIAVPPDATNVEEIIADFDRQPDRLQQIRHNNIVNTLLRHDWAYRWQSILHTLEVEPHPKIQTRMERLKATSLQI